LGLSWIGSKESRVNLVRTQVKSSQSKEFIRVEPRSSWVNLKTSIVDSFKLELVGVHIEGIWSEPRWVKLESNQTLAKPGWPRTNSRKMGLGLMKSSWVVVGPHHQAYIGLGPCQIKFTQSHVRSSRVNSGPRRPEQSMFNQVGLVSS